MKKIALILVFLLMGGVGTVNAVEYQAETSINYNWWDSDNDDRGSQVYVPVTVGATFDAFSFKLLTSFAHTHSDPSGAQSHSLFCVIDTKVNLSYEIIDKCFADLLFGLDFNLPTGKTELDSDDQELLLDPDLVTISQLGEGFNVNPTLTLAKVWNNWGLGIGVGYLWRGEYDYSDTVSDYDPGEIFSLTGEMIHYFSAKWQGRLFGEYAYYGEDEVDGEDFYKEGTFFLVGIGVNYFQTDWDAAVSVEGIFRGKSRFQEEGEGLRTEDRGSYGDEWRVDLTWNYYLSTVTTLRSQANYMLVVENDYAPDSPFYIGDKQKVSVLLAATRQFSPRFRGECQLSGYILDVERNWYHDDDRTYRGFTAAVSMTMSF